MSFVKKLLAGSGKKATEDGDRSVAQFQMVEGQAKKVTKELKKHCDTLAQTAKLEYRLAEELFQGSLGKQNTDASQDKAHGRNRLKSSGSVAKRAPSIVKDSLVQMNAAEKEQELTVRLKLDEERLFLEPLKKYCLLFPTVSSAISRREMKKQDLEKANAKVERYREKQSAKLDAALLDAKRAEEEFAKLNTQLTADIPVLYSGRVEFVDICLGSLIKAEINYYQQMAKSHLETLQTMGYHDTHTLKKDIDSKLDSLFSEMTALSIVSSQLGTDGSGQAGSKK